MNINETMKELAQWQRMQEEAAAMVEALKDQIKEHMTAAGELVKLWDGWSATTGRHIKAFCGLNKAAYMAL